MCVFGTSAWALEKDADGIYQIGTAEDLVAFSELVNGGEITANAVLTADIDMTASSAAFQPIGKESAMYSGTFDGQGHRIKNLNISIPHDFVGVFGLIQSPATIKNFVLDESCTIDGGGNYCAIIGQARGAQGPIYMENLGMEGTIHLTGWNGAGIIGNNKSSVAIFNMKNCYVSGNVTADGNYSGALTGYAGPNGKFENCWVTGEVTGTDNEGSYFIRGMDSGTITNCYSKVGTQAITITDEQLASGELCYLLNGDQSEITWYQTIGEDEHPVLDATHSKVYTTAERRCDGKIIGEGIFTNDETQVSAIPVHQYENDVCIVCGQFNPDFLEMKDGFYQIADGAQLVKFSKAVNAGNIGFNAQLTADIDMSAESANFLPIGCESTKYSGTFDGQGHRIKNLKISLDQARVGVFGVVQTPAIIKNFVLDENCTIECTGNYAGIIGSAMGNKGDIYMENLGMEGTIHLGGWNGAGIIGNNQGNAGIFHMKNCYVTGNVRADGNYSGALTGWAGQNATFENCWVTGEITGTDNEGSYFIRGMESGTITNCYSKVGTQATTITDEQVVSGELCAKLGIPFRQNIGEDAYPVLDPTHGVVASITKEGYATMYIPETSVTIPAGVEAFTGTIVDDQLWLRPLQNVIILGQAVVLKGKAGYYSFMPIDSGDGLVRSDLLGTNGPLETDGSQFVLAKKDGIVGFYKAEGTIPAGKAYLLGGANVKGFGLSFDGETGIAETVEATENDAIYDLSGRRVEKATKGIYVVNGKKFVK